MKKRVFLLCLAMLLTMLCACGGEKAEPVVHKGLETIKAADPGDITRITYTFDTAGGPIGGEITDEETIKAVHDLIQDIQPGEKATQSATDSGLLIQAELNGETIGVRFEWRNILVDSKEYVAENLSPLKSYLGDLLREAYEETYTEETEITAEGTDPTILDISPIINWGTQEDFLEYTGYEGIWVPFCRDYQIYLPKNWLEVEITKEMSQQGVVFVLVNPGGDLIAGDTDAQLIITHSKLDGELTLEEMAQNCENAGLDVSRFDINYLPCICIASDEKQFLSMAFIDTEDPSYMYQVAIYSTSDWEDPFVELCIRIFSTIYPYQP